MISQASVFSGAANRAEASPFVLTRRDRQRNNTFCHRFSVATRFDLQRIPLVLSPELTQSSEETL